MQPIFLDIQYKVEIFSPQKKYKESIFLMINCMIHYNTSQHISIMVSGKIIKQTKEQEGYTILNCTYYTPPKYAMGCWVKIYPTSYIVDSITGERLKMMNAINIPLEPERYYLKKVGDFLNFILVFPKMPTHWSSFNFIEQSDDNNGFSLLGIKKNSSGLYRVIIK